MHEYRITEIDGWYEPQMKYKTTTNGDVWHPLDREGYWADPGAYTTGIPGVRVLVNSLEIAQAIIEKAKRLNS